MYLAQAPPPQPSIDMDNTMLLRCLYTHTSLSDALSEYQNLLSQAYSDTKNPRFIKRIPAILRYRQILTEPLFNEKFVEELEVLKQLLSEMFPGIHFQIQGRLKSFISYDNKVTKRLDDLRSTELFDLFAFRIVIKGKKKLSRKKLVEACYSIANALMEYYLSTAYYFPIPAEEVQDTMRLGSNLIGKIYIPEESGILPEYLFAVKDYILTPKENGYQSLHLIFRNASGIAFEVQIRTEEMDKNATEGYGKHGSYKESKYTHCLQYDPASIALDGYKVLPDGSIEDSIGFDTPKILFSYDSSVAA